MTRPHSTGRFHWLLVTLLALVIFLPAALMAAPLPPSWSQQDIGSVGVAGSGSYDNGTFAISGSGVDIWNRSDSFHYVYQPFSGDGEIIARVASLQNVDPWSKAGVMIRATLAANSPHAIMVLTPGNGAAFQRRETTGAVSLHTAGPMVTAPYWVRLVRNGNTFSGYVSGDGVSWTFVGSDTVAMAGTVYVGLAITSGINSMLCTATLDGVTVTGIQPDTTPPTVTGFAIPPTSSSLVVPITTLTATDNVWVTGYLINESATKPSLTDAGWSAEKPVSYTFSTAGTKTLYAWARDAAGNVSDSRSATVTVTTSLPPPWSQQDIGSVGVAGSGSYDNGTFAISGSGIDIWDSSDSFHYVYQPFSGDGEIVARVASLQNVDPWSKAGVMIRATLAANSPHAMMVLTPGNGAAFQRRKTTGAVSLHTAGPKVTAPYWVRLVRNGNTFSGYVSGDGVSWTFVGSDTVIMADPVYVGLAITSGINSMLCTATLDGVTVTGIQPDTMPPTVTGFAIPPTSSSLVVPITTLTATDNVGVTGYLVNESATKPLPTDAGWSAEKPVSYTFSTAGTKTLYAWARDAAGNVSDSRSATVTVTISLPPSWSQQDIGSVGVAGSGSYDNGTFTISGSGVDIWNRSDSFHYVYQPFSGDGEIVARVASLQHVDPWSKAGVMIRATLAANSPHAMMVLTPGNGAAFQRRKTTGAVSLHTAGLMVTAPYWVRLVRNGNTFSGYVSGDGASWTFVGSDTVAMAGSIYVGLAITSGKNSKLCTATIDNLSVRFSDTSQPTVTDFTMPSTWPSLVVPITTLTATDNVGVTGYLVNESATKPSPTDAGWSAEKPASYTFTTAGTKTLYAWARDAAGNVSDSRSATVTVTISLPPPWSQQDIGSVGVAGSGSYDNGTFTISGAGTDIRDSADAFHYVYQSLSGDGEITARVTSLENTAPSAKAGVMIRGTLDANAPYALMAITLENGVTFRRRLVAGATSLGTDLPSLSLPYWLKLVRSGNVISGYISPDGTQWQLIGSDIVAMATNVYVGMAVTSGTITAAATATIADVAISSTSLPAPPPTGVTLLEESFNDSQLRGRGWFDGGTTAPVIVYDPERGNVLELNYPSGSRTPDNGGAMRRMFTEADDIMISYYIKYQGGWLWPDSNAGPHEFYLLTNMEPDPWTGLADTFLTTYIEAIRGKPSISFQDAKNIDQNNIGVSLVGITEERGVMGCNGSSDQYPDGSCYGNPQAKINGKIWTEPILPVISTGGWRSVKVRLKMNSIIGGKGVADGIIQYWLDDVPAIYHPDVMIRTGEHPNTQWNEFVIAPYFIDGAPQQQKFWIDELSIRTVVTGELQTVDEQLLTGRKRHRE